MSTPAISVIMSSYNVEKYIGEAIESILNQTFKDFEFIIVDDASTDATYSVIKKYDDTRIKLFQNEKNSGPAVSHNKSLSIAKGKYIALMDSDDISHPLRLEKLYEFMEKNPQIDVCGTYMKLFGSENSIRTYSTDDKELKAGLLWGSTMPHATVLMRRDSANKHQLHYDESLRVGTDSKFWCDAKEFLTFSNLKESLYFYRRGEQNITVKFSEQTNARHAQLHKMMLTDLGINFSEYELLLHRFIIGLFSITPSAKVVKDAHAWKYKLLTYNRAVNKYDRRALEKIANNHWNHLFFKLVPYGFKTVLAYGIVSGISTTQLSYYLKYNLNKLIGRKK